MAAGIVKRAQAAVLAARYHDSLSTNLRNKVVADPGNPLITPDRDPIPVPDRFELARIVIGVEIPAGGERGSGFRRAGHSTIMTSIIRIYTHLVALSRPKIVTVGPANEQMPAPPFGNAMTDN